MTQKDFETAGMASSYETYYESNVYDERYPSPNRRTTSRVAATVGPTSVIVDVGAGNGRYAIPLALDGHRILAVERSSAALAQIERRIDQAGIARNLEIYADLADVPAVDLARATHVLLLFGVLGHMTFGERQSVLALIGSSMPSVGRVIGSVPNRLRRFSDEQRRDRIVDDGAGRRFGYIRTLKGITSTFEYTAFSPDELRSELAGHGWHVDRLAAESVLAEETVTNHRLVGWLDGILSLIMPPSLGYGIYFEAGPMRSAQRSIDKKEA